MGNKLVFQQYIDLPSHPASDFDHDDAFLANGRVFIANTAAGTVEVIDGERLQHLATLPGCPEASGAWCGPAARDRPARAYSPAIHRRWLPTQWPGLGLATSTPPGSRRAGPYFMYNPKSTLLTHLGAA